VSGAMPDYTGQDIVIIEVLDPRHHIVYLLFLSFGITYTSFLLRFICLFGCLFVVGVVLCYCLFVFCLLYGVLLLCCILFLY
jgi:hypothetical protein